MVIIDLQQIQVQILPPKPGKKQESQKYNDGKIALTGHYPFPLYSPGDMPVFFLKNLLKDMRSAKFMALATS